MLIGLHKLHASVVKSPSKRHSNAQTASEPGNLEARRAQHPAGNSERSLLPESLTVFPAPQWIMLMFAFLTPARLRAS